MNSEETYILNPAYALKRDSKRVVLTSYEEVGKELNGIKYDNSTIFLLHPINAQMLAFIDGTRPLGACISAMAAHFDLAEEEVREIVSKFIENKDRLHIRWKDQYINFPINLLVPAGRFKRRETYRPEQFAFDGEIDLFYSRMYSPVNLTWEMTMRCFTDCTYCYADRSRAVNETLMPLEQALGLIRECRSWAS